MPILTLTEEQVNKLVPQAVWETNQTSIEHIVRIYGLLKLELPEDLLKELNYTEKHSQYKIYRYMQGSVDTQAFPSSIIFPDQLEKSLPKTSRIVLGERVETIYYDRFDTKTFQYSEPVIRVSYKFVRDEAGLAQYKIRKIEYMMESEKWGDQFSEDIIPFSSAVEKQSELKVRRQNIVVEAQGKAQDLGLASASKDLYRKYDREISRYIGTGSADLANVINADTEYSWLNLPTSSDSKVSVRHFLVNYFSIGLQ